MAADRPRLLGLLVTFRRPEALAAHLGVLAEQTRRLDHLLVVDNGSDQANEKLLSSHRDAASTLEYLAMPDNLGPAGAIGRGLQHLLDNATADDADWVVLLDDDDPPGRQDTFERLLGFATDQLASHPRLGMVGMTGARFDFRRGQTVRLTDDELHGAIPVDYVGGGMLPLLQVAAVRDVGGFSEGLFFGLDDLEFGLRLARGGYQALVDGELALWARTNAGRLGGGFGGPRLGQTAAPWRRYYSLRNLIHILRMHGHGMAALRVSATAGLAKAAVVLVRQRRSGARYFWLSLRAIVDGWTGRLGRTVDPG